MIHTLAICWTIRPTRGRLIVLIVLIGTRLIRNYKPIEKNWLRLPSCLCEMTR